jgi:phosphoribosyl-ATP pyrophosphohydrolase/phosphoribosyl-AMP cyclohydrolase
MSTCKLEFLTSLESIIVDRIKNPSEASYTSSLIAEGPRRIAQKVGEEAVELALASVVGDRLATVSEAADLVYHLLVLLNSQGITLSEVAAELESRHSS